jgi:hypothetical protein
MKTAHRGMTWERRCSMAQARVGSRRAAGPPTILQQTLKTMIGDDILMPISLYRLTSHLLIRRRSRAPIKWW